MIFDLEQHTASLGVGEFAEFDLGPQEGGAGGAAGLWRAQLGTRWHQELRAQAAATHGTAARFELNLTGRIFHRGWTLVLTGRIDQLLQLPAGTVLREIKSVTCALPADEGALRADYPGYFIQLATYAALLRLGLADAAGAPSGTELPRQTLPPGPCAAELVFVEAGSGLLQTVRLSPADETLFRHQLERVVEFLELRARARQRLRQLTFRPAFATARPGQESTRAELTALFQRHPLVLFEAPTGFGKTGVLLEFALDQLRSGHFDRVLYLTSKSTGQLQVIETLRTMTVAAPPSPPRRIAPGAAAAEPPRGTPVAAWHVRNKGEHCINPTFHCVRDVCPHLAGAAERWGRSGLSRFYLDENHARDLETLREAGRGAGICPYEITRVALAFNDVWIGDYNYVFSPRNRSLFFEQPGFTPGRTLLLVDEAHNLPARVADAHSHAFSSAEAFSVRDDLQRLRPTPAFRAAWDHWCHFLHQLPASDGLSAADEDDARHLLAEVARKLPAAALDFAALGPASAEALWAIPSLVEEIEGGGRERSGRPVLPRLWWSPRGGELVLTCLDAAAAIGPLLRDFGGIVLASATLSPMDRFTAACGLDAAPDAAPPTPPPAPARLGALNARDTRRLYRQLTSAAELLRVEESRDAATPTLLRAHAPWRERAYEVACDSRVDTTFQHRSHHFTTTAATLAELCHAAQGPIAVFFPSYAYAEAIQTEATAVAPTLRLALQPKLRDLAAQTVWVEESLRLADALFLVLGSSFAEGIDALGGRITHAMVVGPALPEVNAVQRARLAEVMHTGCSRDAAFRQVYQIPGMTKVNQALGRLVRAPGQRARVLLHCRRFAEPSYASLLAPEYRQGTQITGASDLATWLAAQPLPPSGHA